MTNEEIKELARKVQYLACSNDKYTLIKLGSIKGKIDIMYDIFQSECNKNKLDLIKQRKE